MRKLIATIGALSTLSLLLCAGPAQAGTERGPVNTRVTIDRLVAPSTESGTFKFKGRVVANKRRCERNRRVTVKAIGVGGTPSRGVSDRDGRYTVDTGAGLIVVADYEASVERVTRGNVTCGDAVSRPFKVEP